MASTLDAEQSEADPQPLRHLDELSPPPYASSVSFWPKSALLALYQKPNGKPTFLCTRRPISVHLEAVGRRRKQPETDPKLAVAYLRVSKDEQKLGPQAQRSAIDTWAERESVQVVSWHFDNGISGGAPPNKRPGLLESISSLQEYKAGILVVQKRDRLARDLFEGIRPIESLVAEKGARIVATDGIGNDDGSSGFIGRRMVDIFAEYERLVIAERTRAALRAKKKRGEAMGNAPYGFRKVYRKEPDPPLLVEDSQEQQILAEIIALRVSGLSLRAIVKSLNDRGVAARKTRWHLTTVADLLRR